MIEALIKWGIIAALVAGALAAIWKAWDAYVGEPYREDGRIEQREKMNKEFTAALKAQLGCASVELCGLMVDGMGAQIAQQNAAVQAWQRTANARAGAAAAAETKAKAEVAALASEYQKLMALPPSTPGSPCQSACTLLRSQPLL